MTISKRFIRKQQVGVNIGEVFVEPQNHYETSPNLSVKIIGVKMTDTNFVSALQQILNSGLPVAIVVGITEVIKRGITIDDRKVPIVSLIVSLLLTTPYAMYFFNFNWFASIIIAIGIALSASGAWSWGKQITKVE